MDELLYEKGRYRTRPRSSSALTRAFPSARFFTRLSGIVMRAGRKARSGGYDTAAWCASSLEVVRALEGVGVRIEIGGVENFRGFDGPAVFIGNHMSALETLVLPAIIASTKEATFVVKDTLLRHPLMRDIMRARNLIVVGRKNPREDLHAVLEGGEERIRAGISIVVFPQTTRTPVFDPATFSSIGVKLARRADVPVVPVALKTDAWGNGRLWKDIGGIDPGRTVHFEFGTPFRIVGRGVEEHRRIIEFIAGRIGEWDGTVIGGPS